MKNFLLNKKRVVLIVLVILSIISIVFIIFSVQKNKKPLNTPSPTPVVFEFLRSIPANGSKTLFPNTSAIELDFSKPVDVSTLIISINPKIEYTTEFDFQDSVIFIKPIESWNLGQRYDITLSVKSKDKESLKSSVQLNFEANNPKSSQLDEVPTGK